MSNTSIFSHCSWYWVHFARTWNTWQKTRFIRHRIWFFHKISMEFISNCIIVHNFHKKFINFDAMEKIKSDEIKVCVIPCSDSPERMCTSLAIYHNQTRSCHDGSPVSPPSLCICQFVLNFSHLSFWRQNVLSTCLLLLFRPWLFSHIFFSRLTNK